MKRLTLLILTFISLCGLAMSDPKYDPLRVDHTTRLQYPLTQAQRFLLMNCYNTYCGASYTLNGVEATDWPGYGGTAGEVWTSAGAGVWGHWVTIAYVTNGLASTNWVMDAILDLSNSTWTVINNVSNNIVNMYTTSYELLSNNTWTVIGGLSNNTWSAMVDLSNNVVNISVTADNLLSNNTWSMVGVFSNNTWSYIADFSNDVWAAISALDEYVKTNHTAGNVSVSGRVSVGAQKMFASLPGDSQGDIELSVYKVDGYGPSIAVVGGTGEYMDYGWQYTNGATTNMFTLTMEQAGSILTLYSYHNDVWSSMLSIYTNGTWNFRDNSITNIGLAEASSLQLGPVSATVTNISDSSSTSSSNELMTAHAIDTKVNQHADGAFFSLWFDTNAHSSVVGYGIMSSDIVATTQTVALVNVTNNQILGVCASEITDFNPSQLYGGHPIEVEIYAYNPSAGGDKDVAIKVNVYKRTGATEVLLGTTTTTPVIDEATIGEYIMDFLLQTNVSWTSGVDILVAKGIAVVTGSGGAPELNYVFGGQYDTSLGVPIPAGDFVFKTDFIAGTNTVTDAFVAADAVVTNAVAAQSNNLVTMYGAADTAQSNNLVTMYGAADTAQSNNLVTMYGAADTAQSNNLVTMYGSADTAQSNNLEAMYIAADVVVAAMFDEEHRMIQIQDPTNGIAYWCENPFGAAVTVSEVFPQSIGMTGLVSILKRTRTSAWNTYTMIDTNIVVDADGTVDAGGYALTNNQYIGVIFSGLSAFDTTNRVLVEFQFDLD